MQQAYRHFRTALALWPKDNLRPETQFNEIIQRGIERRYTTPNIVDEAKELKQVNALYALADDRFKKTVSNHHLVSRGDPSSRLTNSSFPSTVTSFGPRASRPTSKT